MNLFISSLAVALALSSSSMAQLNYTPKKNYLPQTTGALEKCANLLPCGYQYRITIHAWADKRAVSQSDRLISHFDITDNSQQTLDEPRKLAVEPFIKCMTSTVL